MADNGQDQASRTLHVVIVGGGVSGLAAAFFLKDKPVRVTVLEGASRLGGKLSVSDAQTEDGASFILFIAYCRRDPELMLRALATFPQTR